MTDTFSPARRLLIGSARAPRPAAAQPFTLTRNRFIFPDDAVLPQVNTLYMIPFSQVDITESTDCKLQADNTVKINKAGLYRVALCTDWVGQQGEDVGLRTYGIRRRPASSLAARSFDAVPDDLTPIDDVDEKLATAAVPGASPPESVRYVGNWQPGVVPLGGVVSTDVTLPTTGLVGLGDVVLASHSAIVDSVIGAAAVSALFITAKVMAPDVVRVSLFNPTIAAGIKVPLGKLRVLAMNAVDSRGESADAWTVLQTVTLDLKPKDLIYGVFGSGTPGDYMQASESSYLQVERWG